MTKRIFRSICVVALCVFGAAVVLFLGVLYNYFSGVQMAQLEIQTELAAQGVAHEGIAYFDGLCTTVDRITWIDTDGTVLYDNRSDSEEMENHLERAEIKEALANGAGESTRYSETLLERALYCARRLPDGTVLRLSIAQSTLLSLLLGMLQPICWIFVVALVLSLILAARLSRRIVKPLNALDLDAPLHNEGYDELSPLLNRIHAQQTQIKQQTSQLAQKQREFETVTNGMAEGIILLNPGRCILSINPAAARLLGTDGRCVGKWMCSVCSVPALQEVLLQASEGRHGETRMELAGRVYQVEASPVDSDGQVLGTVLLLLDVTEKHRSEEIRREFTANVSHELKTPLHAISGYAELMANGMVKPEDLPRFAGRIYAEAQRMIQLVEDIIKLSHLDEGAADVERETVDLYDVARETVASLQSTAAAAEVNLTLCGGSAHLLGVPQLLWGICYNLCENAIKYNRPGGSVTVTVAEEETDVRLTVADTGIGILPEHQERIFERFYRVDKSHSKAIGGTGLGLSIVKHAARLHRASLTLESEPDVGTTITVLFPK